MKQNGNIKCLLDTAKLVRRRNSVAINCFSRKNKRKFSSEQPLIALLGKPKTWIGETKQNNTGKEMIKTRKEINDIVNKKFKRSKKWRGGAPKGKKSKQINKTQANS